MFGGGNKIKSGCNLIDTRDDLKNGSKKTAIISFNNNPTDMMTDQCILSSGESLLVDTNWDEISGEINDILSFIDENINIQVWDDTSGHYVI